MRRSLAALLVVSLAVLLVAFAAPAEAQTAAERSLARDQFQAGVAAARGGDWAAAAEAFQRSYELAPRPLTLLNLAGAFQQVGRLVEAAEAYRMFLLEDGITARQRRDAEDQLAGLEPRIPRVRLRVLGLVESDRVTLDEYQLSLAALDELYPVDPGEHAATVERDGHAARVVPFTASEGVQQDVLIDARPESWPALVAEAEEDAPAPAPAPEPLPAPAEGRSIAEEPAFWVVLGAVLVAGGVGVGLGVGLTSTPEPFMGNTAPFRVELP